MSAERKTTTAEPEKATDAPAPKKTTTKRPDEMKADVLEFITAIDDYKRANQRPFPTWSEVLDIIKDLGYTKA